MLRITIRDDPGRLTFQLEGSLVGAWAKEAMDCWQRTVNIGDEQVIRLDLSGVTMIDAAGKQFLAEAHARGATLTACGCMIRAVVAQITNTAIPDHECR